MASEIGDEIMKRTLVIALFLAITVILIGCNQKPICKDIQTSYQEEACTNKLKINEVEMTFTDSPVQSSSKDECPEKGGIANYGNIQLKLEVINQNNILLSTKCKLIIRRNDFLSPKILDEQQIETITMNIPAQDTKTLTKNVYLPKCYDFIGLECKDIDELPECEPITKYRTEQKCE